MNSLDTAWREILDSGCPACGGCGFTTGVECSHGCGGDEERCASICPMPEEVQYQCDCNTHILTALKSALVERLKEKTFIGEWSNKDYINGYNLAIAEVKDLLK